MGLTLTSSAFRAGETIPMVHTCDGADGSPPLAWSGAAARAAAFALIVDDPDAPGRTCVHWVLYDLPAGTTGLAADVPKVERLPALGGAATTFAHSGGADRARRPDPHTAMCSRCTPWAPRWGSSRKPRSRS